MTYARIVTLASAKGGSGKTLISASIGTLLAALGKRVIIIDTDAATTGLSLLFLQKVVAHRSTSSRPIGLFEGSSDEFFAERDLVELSDNFYLLPASFNFVDTENTSPRAFKEKLSATIASLRQEYDFIILDAQAGADPFARCAASRELSDMVLIVSEFDPMSAAGVERLKGLLGEDLEYSRTWILLNKVLPEFAKEFSSFLEVARYLRPIPWDAEVVRAYSRRSLAVDVVQGNEHTISLIAIVRSLFPELEADIKAWLVNRAKVIREPVVRQLSSVRERLVATTNAIAEIERRRFAMRRLRFVAGGVVGLGVAVGLGVFLQFTTVLASSLASLISVGTGLVIGLIGAYGSATSVGNAHYDSEKAELEIERNRLQRQFQELRDLEEMDPAKIFNRN